LLALLDDNRVMMVSVAQQQQQQLMYNCNGHRGAVLDFCFSACGAALVTAR
jgi:hypothetical protein